MNRIFAATAAASIALASGAARSAEMPLPHKLQGALFKKILLYDRTLEGREEVPVYVVPGADSGAADDLAAALGEAGLHATVTRSGQLGSALAAGSVVYLMPGALTPGLQELCASRKALTIAGVPSWAERGEVSIALDSAEGKPVILINLRRARSEGHEFSAQLLRLAKVVQ